MPVSDDQRRQWIKEQTHSLGDMLMEALAPGLSDGVVLARIVSEYKAKFATDKTLAGAGIELGFTAFADLLAGFFALLSAFRKETTHTFDPTVAELLTEFLGVEFDAKSLATAAGPEEVFQKAQKIGTLIHDRLQHEFAPNGVVTPDTGATAARTFSGYVTNFAIQNAIIALVGAVIPDTHLDDIRELGVEIAQNLGLGRLHRAAMRPLVDNTITKPYDRKLRKQYRMDLLPAVNYVRAFNAGRMSREELSNRLGELGLTEADITELTVQGENILPLVDLVREIRWGKMTKDQAVTVMVNHGWSKALAAQLIDGALLARPDTHVDRFLNVIQERRARGFLDQDAFNKLLSDAPITDDERQWIAQVAALENETPHRRITFAQLEAGIIAGIVTWDYFDTWTTAEGYDADSKLVLEYEVLLKLGVAATKQQITSGTARGSIKPK